jgi:Arc/MetJ family transcription regulator
MTDRPDQHRGVCRESLGHTAIRRSCTITKKDTVHAALRTALRTSAAHALTERMAENTNGVDDEDLVNDMWRARQPLTNSTAAQILHKQNESHVVDR